MLKVALTGGIASGKTAVSNQFALLGVPIIDADILSRQAVAPGSPGLEAVIERFGQGVTDSSGALNRAALRKIVFSDRDSRADLEAIIHPLVRTLTRESIERHAKTDTPYCIVVIPLLVETQQHHNYDYVIVVDVSEEIQISRLMRRDGSSAEQARKILRSQVDRAARLAVANSVINNSGSLEAMENRVRQLHQELLVIAGK